MTFKFFNPSTKNNNLMRFHKAQEKYYNQAFEEIKTGKKTGHWIWYIFPQIKGLGKSSNSSEYAISDFNEACDYLNDPKLFTRYVTMIKLVESQLKIPIKTLMGSDTDAKKFASSLTLFQSAATYLSFQSNDTSQELKDLERCCIKILDAIAEQGYPRCHTTDLIINNHFEINHNKTPLKWIKESNKIVSEHITLTTSIDLNSLKNDLNKYIFDRTNEWSFHYNFLGIMSLIYYIHDAVLGTDYYNSKSREIKLSAASKLHGLIDDPSSTEQVSFSASEKEALKEGRLGLIINTYGGLDNVLKNVPDTSIDSTITV